MFSAIRVMMEKLELELESVEQARQSHIVTSRFCHGPLAPAASS